jgi:D-glycero-alpha-D-manno-heptose 1-phosphate guanylyltransferase
MNNKINIDLSEIDTVILAGGLGTRLKSVLNDKPKCLASIKGKPFIDILLDDCINQGLRRFILCVGYLKEQVIEYLSKRNNCEIVFSEESEPFGTGGALKIAEPHIRSDTFLAMNSDTYIEYPLLNLLNFHIRKQADMSILLSNTTKGDDYGNVIVNSEKRILSFCTKTIKDTALVNAGVYCLQTSLLFKENAGIPQSFEIDWLPTWIEKYNIYGEVTDIPFHDIGTPKRFNAFQKIQSR